MFHAWPNATKAAAIEQLALSLHTSGRGSSHLLVLEQALRPLLQRDFVAHLPEEVATAILLYLPPVDVLRCSQV
jgi:hypothetical protein